MGSSSKDDKEHAIKWKCYHLEGDPDLLQHLFEHPEDKLNKN